MARDYSAVNRIRKASHEVSVQDTPASLFIDNIELHLARYYPIIDKLKSQKPDVRIEVLKKCSYLGRLTLAPSFTLWEYNNEIFSTKGRYDREKYVIHEVTEGWYLKDALEYTISAPHDEAYNTGPGMKFTSSITIGSDGRSWLDGFSANDADEPTFGVIGSGNLLQSFTEANPNYSKYATPGNISSVNNRLSRLITREL